MLDRYPAIGWIEKTRRGLAEVRCVAGDAGAGREHLATLRAESGDREFVPWIQAAILEAEAQCHRAAGDPKAALQVLDEAARVAEDMARGEAAARARRDLLRARLQAALDDRESAVAALSRGRRVLENAGLGGHPFMARIRSYREKIRTGQCGMAPVPG